MTDTAGKSGLTHIDKDGRARMVDVGAKDSTHRVAVAEGRIEMQPGTLAMIRAGDHSKGDVLGIARVAGIMAAKQTASLIPLCHPLPLDKCDVKIEPENDSSLRVLCECSTSSRTGVEMEALTGASVAALTIYDMCKASNPSIEITRLHLVEKRGGKSDFNAV